MARPALILALAALTALAGCSGPEGDEGAPSTSGSPPYGSPLALASSSFADGGAIPVRHTCDGEEVSPPLDLAGFPAGTVSLALLVKDHDVPTPQTPLRTIDHWAVWAFGPAAPDFPEGGVPSGARQHANGWQGPCPPQGSPAHRYVFTLYALDTEVDLPEGSTAAEVEAAMAGHVLASAELTGTYQRQVP